MKRIGKITAAAFFASLLLITASACQSANKKEEIDGDPVQSEETLVPDLPLPAPDQPQPPVPPQEEEQPPAVRTVQYIRVKTNGLNVRARSSAASASLGQVDADVGMLYLGEENGFYKTFYRNQTAYISARTAYTELYGMPYTSEAVEEVIEEGCKVIGTPYVFGAVRYHDGNGRLYSGFTVTKFDCSSLTQYIFFKGSSKLLQVNTRTQISQGKHVEREDLRRGDLIFFTNDSRRNNKGIERVGHVAMYLGDNLILHTASDYCKIESMTAKRWNYYIEARRMIDA